MVGGVYFKVLNTENLYPNKYTVIQSALYK